MTFLPNPPCLPDAFGNGGPETVGARGLPMSDVPAWAYLERLSNSLERMVQIQMTAYPDAWSDEDKREMAERELFGERGA